MRRILSFRAHGCGAGGGAQHRNFKLALICSVMSISAAAVIALDMCASSALAKDNGQRDSSDDYKRMQKEAEEQQKRAQEDAKEQARRQQKQERENAERQRDSQRAVAGSSS